jgi:thiol-disulfide isomerase/thioredoxin
MGKIFKLLIIAIILTSCKTKNNGFTITGYIDGIKDSTLIKIYDLDRQLDMDSAYSNNGNFTLLGKVEKPTTCWLRVNGESIVIQVENVDMTFTSTIKDIRLNSKITGGREQDLQNELQKLQKPYDIIYLGAYDSLVNKKYSNDDEKQKLIKKFNESQSLSHEIYINFGKNHYNSYLGLNIIYRNRKSIPKDSIKLIYQNLKASFKETTTAKALEIFLYNDIAKVGEKYIDFSAKTIDDKDFTFSSLKDKYIYLSFWSSGCAPCRMENRFFSENLDSVPKDLAIVSFSIDKNLGFWKKASTIDNIFWHNVSDYEGDQGGVKTIYGVQALPTSFLIDKKGIIIKKFTGFDPDGNIIEELKKIIN